MVRQSDWQSSWGSGLGAKSSILIDHMSSSSAWESKWRSSFIEHHLWTAKIDASTQVSSLSSVSLSSAAVAMSSPSTLPDSSLGNYTYQFNGTMAIVILVVFCAFLVLGFIGYYVSRCFSPPSISTAQQAADLRSVQKKEGLAPEVIESFPIVAYSAASMSKHCTECAVCLAEFEEDEKTRVLPKCKHAFHPECIDKWLQSHSTCPLCRVSLLSDSHAIEIHSELPQSAIQENFDAMSQGEPRGPSEAMPGLNNGVERVGEREAVLALSRSSRNFGLAAMLMENRERVAAASERYVVSTIGNETSTSSRWINRLKRSASLERPRSDSKKREASGNSAESSIKEVQEKNDSLGEQIGAPVASRRNSAFFSRSRSEKINYYSANEEKIEISSKEAEYNVVPK